MRKRSRKPISTRREVGLVLRYMNSRSTGYVLQKNGNRACRVSQAYGTYGRIAVASFIHANVEQKFHYGYLQGSDLLQTLSMPNGVTLTQEYEEKRNLLTSMGYVRENSVVTQRKHTYDALARPETRDTRYPNKSISHNDSFAYNHRRELTGAPLGNSAYTYAYDNIGNREIAQEAAEGITYAANELNRYTRISTDGENYTPEYEADGNQTLVQISTGIWHVTYNAQNRAVKFESADGSTLITCAYDYAGRRFEKKVTTKGGITTHQRFLYRGYLQIAALYMLRSHQPALWYITWDPTQPVATSPLAIRPAGNLTQPIQWSSECYDPKTALVYYNYRYYNPQDGRWTSRDPIGIKGEVNLYAFGNNIPTQTFDHLGKDLYAIDGTNYDYGESGNVAKFYDWYQGMSDSLYNS